MDYVGSIFINNLKNETFCSLIEKAIKASGIKSFEDINNIEKNAVHGMANRFEHPWIQYIHWGFLKQQTEIEKSLEANRIHFLDIQYYNICSFYLTSLNCFFPKKITLALADTTLAQEVKIQDTGELIRLCLCTGLDVFRRFLLHEDLFRNNLITVAPQMVTSLCNSEKCEIFSWKDKNNICYIDQLGLISDNNSKAKYIRNLDINKLYIELPILRNLYPDEFNELRDKYKIEFLRFEAKMNELLFRCKNGEELASIIIKEYNDASLEIKRIFIEKTAQLKKTGRNAVLGIILTAIPILFKEYIPFDSEIISSIVGGETIFSTFKDIFKDINAERNNPYWLLWKWEQEQIKNNNGCDF